MELTAYTCQGSGYLPHEANLGAVFTLFILRWKFCAAVYVSCCLLRQWFSGPYSFCAYHWL